MRENSSQLLVQCPFYRYDDGRRKIACEGIVEGSTISQTYSRKEDFGIQLKVFCCGRYKNCEICRILMEKYED